MDDHAGKRGSTNLLCNQRNNDLHWYGSKGTTDNCAHIADPVRHGLSCCSRPLLHGISSRLHSATRRKLPNPSGSTDPLERGPSTLSSKNPFFLDSPVISTRIQVKVRLRRG